MFNLKSILFSAVITGISVSNLHSTLSYSAYVMGELRKEDQSFKASLKTHNIAHQKFPKISQALSCTSEEKLRQQILQKQEERIKEKIRLSKIKYATNLIANHMQNWYELCIFITNMPQDISEEKFFKEAEKILNNKRVNLYQQDYPQNILEDDNRIIYFVQVVNDKISFLNNAIKEYQLNCKVHKVTTSNKRYLLQLTVGYISYIMLNRCKQNDALSIYKFLNNHQELINPVIKINFEKFLSFLKDAENCDMSYNSINNIIKNYIN